MASIQERVARHFIAEMRQGPLTEWIDAAPQALESIHLALGVYDQIAGQLTEVQAALDSVPLGRTLKNMAKQVERLKALFDQIRTTIPKLVDLNQDYLAEVRRAAAEVRQSPSQEYNVVSLRSRVGPLLGEVRKIARALDTSSDWMPYEGEIEDINASIESRKLDAVIRMYGKLPDLSEHIAFSEIGDFLQDIDDNLEGDIDDEISG